MIEMNKGQNIWEKYVGLIQVEVNHTYPDLYTAGAVLVCPQLHNMSGFAPTYES